MTDAPHIMIVQSRFYEDVSDFLLQGAVQALDVEGFTYEEFAVSGVLEIPAAIRVGHDSGKFDGFIALGCVIRGETSHYDIVAGESARGLNDLSLAQGLLVGNGILTCDTKEQALVRADPEQRNKGKATVQAVIDLLNIKRNLGLSQLK